MLDTHDKRHQSWIQEIEWTTIMKIGTVIVLYNPEQDKIEETMVALSKQVDEICLIDNSSSSHCSWFPNRRNLKYIHLGENKGIAYAQNVGIIELQKLSCDFILFSDQDSKAMPSLVESLVKVHSLLREEGIKVATVGTVAINERTGKKYPFRHKVFQKKTLVNTPIIEVDYVRNSMSLTSLEVINQVGLMDASLFIDGVDSEWCWRARTKGYRTFIAEECIIYHCLGRSDRRLLTKDITIPSPNRLFYQYRNFLWLLFRGYVPLRWKLKNLVKYLIKIPYYSLCCSPRTAYFRNIMCGICAGFTKNRM